ncbi:MAG: DUF2017 domain-containing protein [Frankiaceae bacterium]
MARAFRRTRQGYRCRLERTEAFILRRLADEVDALIAREAGEPPDAARDPGATGAPGSADALEAQLGVPTDVPPRSGDPVLDRLFPDAYADAADAADFRRYTLADLSAGKRAGLALLRSTVDERGGDVILDEEGAQVWLAALNDLRLALGTRIGVTEDNVDELAGLDPDDPRALLFDAYDLLTYLQGTLVEAVAGW